MLTTLHPRPNHWHLSIGPTPCSKVAAAVCLSVCLSLANVCPVIPGQPEQRHHDVLSFTSPASSDAPANAASAPAAALTPANFPAQLQCQVSSEGLVAVGEGQRFCVSRRAVVPRVQSPLSALVQPLRLAAFSPAHLPSRHRVQQLHERRTSTSHLQDSILQVSGLAPEDIIIWPRMVSVHQVAKTTTSKLSCPFFRPSSRHSQTYCTHC